MVQAIIAIRAKGQLINVFQSLTTFKSVFVSMGECKKDVTPLLTHWSYVFLALTHLYVGWLEALQRLDDVCLPQIISNSKRSYSSYQLTCLCIWVRSRNCGCLVTWFCYQLIAKPGNKTAVVSRPDPYGDVAGVLPSVSMCRCRSKGPAFRCWTNCCRNTTTRCHWGRYSIWPGKIIQQCSLDKMPAFHRGGHFQIFFFFLISSPMLLEGQLENSW